MMKENKTYSVQEITDYIFKKYSKRCKWLDATDLIEFCCDFFFYEKLGWCGCSCGRPWIAQECIRDFLNIIDQTDENEINVFNKLLEERFGVKSVYDNGLLLCLAYALDSAGFLECGCEIGRHRLTEEGKMFLYVLKVDDEPIEAEE